MSDKHVNPARIAFQCWDREQTSHSLGLLLQSIVEQIELAEECAKTTADAVEVLADEVTSLNHHSGLPTR